MQIESFLNQYPIIWQAIKLVITAAAAFVLVVVVLRLEKKAMKKLLSKKDTINVRFVESIVRFLLILLTVEWVIMSSPLTQSLGRVLFQGTAILGAIAGFAAQPVI